MKDVGPAPVLATGQLFGLPLDPLTMQQTCERCEQAIVDHQTLLLGMLNAAKVVDQRHDPRLSAALCACDLVLPDGMSVVVASRLLGVRAPERVAGIDLFVNLLDEAATHDHSVYLLGATAEVLQLLLERVHTRWPALQVAGSHDGYFLQDPDELARVVDDIRRTHPDMLFVGIPSPHKEIFLAEHRAVLGVPVLHGVGGSFDVLAGITRRAPALLQRTGMEWSYRLVQEPRRLWRRYARTNGAFVLLTVRELTTHRRRTA
ncbi:WecB/TagA/CpsF family glycosyltransferase [Ornithinimicrobium avium]|uniref:Glycosyltransferase n=1 Tax=Ornithinimicrobium avium TaxID=2283195 RepID=A0A345NMY9_9MICO|nr:WecB/TagA/CpsF family glycosyltransferase [Ornithinimicrobium avium]AXH96397.1 glycosyltransferase [Ornithinimicrobium avium]